MEGFIATSPSGKEEWVVKRNGRKFFKTVLKSTPLAEIVRRTITTYQVDGRALPAFHAQKRVAKNKGFKISNFDSSTRPPKRRRRVKALIKRRPLTVKLLGRHVLREEPEDG